MAAARIAIITFPGGAGVVSAQGVQAGDTVLQAIEIGVGAGVAGTDVTSGVSPVAPANGQLAVNGFAPGAGTVAIVLLQPHA